LRGCTRQYDNYKKTFVRANNKFKKFSFAIIRYSTMDDTIISQGTQPHDQMNSQKFGVMSLKDDLVPWLSTDWKTKNTK